MARPRAFDESAVLEQIVRLFWKRGYGATSVRDLEAATGIGMTSLYNAFGGKREIFRSALEHYSEHRTRRCLDDIEHLASPSDRIRTFVSRVTDAALGDPDRMGCLVINTAIELGPHDEEIAETVAGYLAEVEAFFRRNFEAAQRGEGADPDVTPEDAGRSFSALMFGLRVLARTRPDREMMEGAARPLLALLRNGDRHSAVNQCLTRPENSHVEQS
ncbi:TetR/AcrR family transcriptional regulator [Aurantimonas sp. A2-1-M11]|uniref:TetR/AcrR family transcriptional regulator n=1 Tax=Aurantimonas sp. A2-1-M11 TaxID=3113712 RepID=UPI002F939EA6